MDKFDWPLNKSHFTLKDRLKIAKFFLNPKNRWTQGEKVKQYEEKWSKYVGCKHAVMTSSGSTANTLIAMQVKDSLSKAFEIRNEVIVPAVTWQTSVSPWIREGFKPVFIDIDENFCISPLKIKKYLERNHKKVACIFPTSLLGVDWRVEDLFIRKLLEKDIYKNIALRIDDCENSFPTPAIIYRDYKGGNCYLSLDTKITSSTSMYFGHQTTTGSEGGMIFTDSDEEYEYFLMARNHGMVRGLEGNIEDEDIKKYRNKKVDPKFDFYMIGNNFRSCDISAFMGLLDFNKIQEHKRKRTDLSDYFIENLPACFITPPKGSVLFCLPLILKKEHTDDDDPFILQRSDIENYCLENKIEYRPIISGNLLKQTAYKNYKKRGLTMSDHVHKHGVYVGLYPSLKKEKITKLLDYLHENSS